jgi:hypothetical protein
VSAPARGARPRYDPFRPGYVTATAQRQARRALALAANLALARAQGPVRLRYAEAGPGRPDVGAGEVVQWRGRRTATGSGWARREPAPWYLVRPPAATALAHAPRGRGTS